MKDIPDSYRKLTIGRYIDGVLPAILGDYDPVERQARIIGALADMTWEDVLDLPIRDYSEMAARTHFLETEIDTSRMGHIARRYTLGDLVLVPVTDYTKLTAAQFIDFQTYAKEADKNVIPIVATLLVPEGRTYNKGYDVADVQKAVAEHLSVQDAMEVVGFFFALAAKSLQDSLTYSEREAKKMRRKDRKAVKERIAAARAILSRTSGDGWQTSTP